MTFPMEDQYIPEAFRDELDEDLVSEPDMDDEEARAAAERRATRYRRQITAYERVLVANRRTLKASRTPEGIARMKSTVKRVEGQLAKAKRGLSGARRDIQGATGEWGELLQGEERDAFEALQSLFQSFGLATLAPKIFEYVKEGYQADTIALLLQDTAEYKERFAANEARKKAGLAVLSPQEYLQTEAAYRQILESAGMPKGFYDNAADFRQWIAGDVAPTEIKSRVDMAVAATSQANPSYRVALEDMYGIGQNELAAYFLDRAKAEPILKKQAAAAYIGAAAIRRDLRATAGRMEGLAALGVSSEEAEEGYARISAGLESMLGIAGRFGSSWSLEEAENATFGIGGEEKRARLASRERALFGGSAGARVEGLARPYRST